MSENYFQHADHFTRILSEQEVIKKTKYVENISEINSLSSSKEDKKNETLEKENINDDKVQSETN